MSVTGRLRPRAPADPRRSLETATEFWRERLDRLELLLRGERAAPRRSQRQRPS